MVMNISCFVFNNIGRKTLIQQRKKSQRRETGASVLMAPGSLKKKKISIKQMNKQIKKSKKKTSEKR